MREGQCCERGNFTRTHFRQSVVMADTRESHVRVGPSVREGGCSVWVVQQLRESGYSLGFVQLAATRDARLLLSGDVVL